MEIIKDVDLKKYCTFKIGGKGSYLIEIEELSDCLKAIEFAMSQKLPYHILGNGSNILFSSENINAVFIHFGEKFSSIYHYKVGNENFVKAMAGCSLPNLVNSMQKIGLSGLEWAVGIPGTVGGAVFMNAGAFSGQIFDVLDKITVLNAENNEFEEIYIDKINYSYRMGFSSQKHIIIDATFKMKEHCKEDIKRQMQEYMQKRVRSQSVGFPNAGSVFKRGKDYVSAKLIDELGLKGMRVGDAEISTIHSGFIINKGNATSNDVEELIKKISQIVCEKYNIVLQLELVRIGG